MLEISTETETTKALKFSKRAIERVIEGGEVKTNARRKVKRKPSILK